MNHTLKLWTPRLLLAVELALCTIVVTHLDAGLKTEMRDGQPFGLCSKEEFEKIGLAWLGMTSIALVGSLVSLFGRTKWIGLALFILPVIATTTMAKYQEDRFPPCWERPVEPPT